LMPARIAAPATKAPHIRAIRSSSLVGTNLDRSRVPRRQPAGFVAIVGGTVMPFNAVRRGMVALLTGRAGAPYDGEPDRSLHAVGFSPV